MRATTSRTRRKRARRNNCRKGQGKEASLAISKGNYTINIPMEQDITPEMVAME